MTATKKTSSKIRYRLGQSYVEYNEPFHRGVRQVTVYITDDNIRLLAQYREGPCVSPVSLYMDEIETFVRDAKVALASGGSEIATLTTGQ